MSESEKIITKEQAYSRMARICAQKECCANDIRQKLFRLKFSEETAEDVISKLKKANYIDENRFVRSYINDKIKFNKWGKNKIETALRQKQISAEILEKAFSEFSAEFMNESLQPMLEKKWKTINGKSEYEKRTKLIRYALMRGFTMKDVLECLRNMELTDGSDEF